MQMTRDIEDLIDRALSEDLGLGDPTTDILIPRDLLGSSVLIAKEDGVLAGLDVALAVFKRVGPELVVETLISDGSQVHDGDVIAKISGPVASMLKAERTALNFLRRLSGIASETAKYVQRVSEFDVRIIDTRKTTPGMRTLEKYAIRAGGGYNHRQNLGDGILIKDNHIQALRNRGLSLAEIIKTAMTESSHTIRVEVEVEDLPQVKEALDAGAEILLLDNMGVQEMAEAVAMCRGRAVTEASGLINLSSVRDVAASGVDLISVGALTHSVAALDISLDLDHQ